MDDVDEPMPEYLRRYGELLDEHVNAMMETLNRDVGGNLFSGRPDLLTEVYDKSKEDERLSELLMGE